MSPFRDHLGSSRASEDVFSSPKEQVGYKGTNWTQDHLV